MTALILVAAGSGERLAAGKPKALVEVAGETLIGHCLRTVRELHGISHVVVVAPPAQRDEVAAVLVNVTVVAGGSSRDESVRAGLRSLPRDTEHVLIHDAARPFTPTQVFASVMAALEAGAVAVIPGVPVIDTIKQVAAGRVVRTVDRSDLIAVQTPQGFRVADLMAAHAAQTQAVTDDAMLMEDVGHPVQVVEGSTLAFKITTPFDLAVARAMKEGF